MHGRLLYNIGKLDQCQRYFENSFNTKSNNQQDVASLHLQLGRVHGENGVFDHELNNYIHALELMTKDGRTKDLTTVLNNIGSLHFDRGEVDRSIEYYRKALAVRQEYIYQSVIKVQL